MSGEADLQQRLVDAIYGPGHRRSDTVEELTSALIAIAECLALQADRHRAALSAAAAVRPTADVETVARLILSVSAVPYDEADTKRREMARAAAEKVIAAVRPAPVVAEAVAWIRDVDLVTLKMRPTADVMVLGDKAGGFNTPLYASPALAEPVSREAVLEEAVIKLTPAEIQSNYNRVQWAEGLIRQLPERHDGRNSWLLNYGHGTDVEAMRDRHPTYRDNEKRRALKSPPPVDNGREE